MIEKNDNKFLKIENRINSIKIDLEFYHSSVKQLNMHFEGRIKNKNSFAPRKVKFSCLPRSEKVFVFTLQNIKSQISLLERELAVLVEYCS